MNDTKYIDNLTYTMLLSLDGGKSSGSGFLLHFQEIDYLITARHVLFNEDKLRCESLLISSQNSRGKIESASIFELDMSIATVIDKKADDVIAIPIGIINKSEFEKYITIIQDGDSKPLSIDEKDSVLLEKIEIANDVFLIGFPTSLIFQNSKHFDPGKPLLRKGVIAGINSEDNTFIIDCSAYYGNSGGPILELNRNNDLKVAGIVSRYIPFVIEWRNNREISVSHVEYMNSGYSVCVPMNSILNLFK
jgi:hypothetical protein